jgi:uncharacterized protein YndB with AHSA1/START domain
MRFEVSRSIAASPTEVWTVVVDAPAWPSWDSGVISIEGSVQVGQAIKLVSEANPKRAFKLRIVELDEPRRLRLSSGMPLGLFRGVRTYTVEPDGDGARFTMCEEYSGPLAGMITKSIPDLQPSFEHFADGLRQQVGESR